MATMPVRIQPLAEPSVWSFPELRVPALPAANVLPAVPPSARPLLRAALPWLRTLAVCAPWIPAVWTLGQLSGGV